MKYFSTNNKDLRYGFKEAVIKGLAPDNGLFFPVSVPKLDKDFFTDCLNWVCPKLDLRWQDILLVKIYLMLI